MNEDIKVSICCITYNHEKYIKSALDGFLMQKTNFKYEILVHDDASTDSTATIIREYENKYPDIIKPIYQTENQYSKDKNIKENFIFPKVKGKYVALCEGDDYWSDENKLQLQVDFLEKHDDYSLCVHASTMLDEQTKEKKIIRGYEQNKSIEIKEFLKDYHNSKWVLFQTSSYLFRKKHLRELINLKPDFYYNACVGDIPLVLFLGTKGKIYFMDRDMSVYRANTPYSWSKNEYNSSKKLDICYNLKQMYSDFNDFTEKIYDKEINLFVKSFNFTIALLNGDYKDVVKNKSEFKKLNKRTKISVRINIFCPVFGRLLKNMKHIVIGEEI